MTSKRDNRNASHLPGAGYAPKGRSTRAQMMFQGQHVVPLKEAAREVTRLLIADGLVRPRPDACESCGAGGRVLCHHLDYLRPDLIAWLCPRCHRRAHGKTPWLCADGSYDWPWLWAHADRAGEAAS